MSNSKLWVPPKVDKEPRFFCRMCRTQFLTETAMLSHVVKCDELNGEEIREQHRGAHDRFYAYVDPEWEAYNAELRRQGIDPETQYNRGRKSNIRRASES